jgi:hypothetical protein
MACDLQIGTFVVPAKLTSCSDSVQLNYRKIIFAQGGATALAGYAPGANAKSGFTVTAVVPYASAAAFLNASLATAGVTVAMQFGTAGGISIAGCIAFDCKVSGSEGQDVTVAFTFESVSMPTTGATVTAPGSLSSVFGFQDVTSYTMCSGATYTIVNSFTFNITRTRAAYVGNSKTGIAQELGIAYTEVKVDAEWLKQGDAEFTFFLGSGPPLFAQTPADITIRLSQILFSGSPATLTLVAHLAYYDTKPHNVGSETEWVKEAASAMATTGAFTIS